MNLEPYYKNTTYRFFPSLEEQIDLRIGKTSDLMDRVLVSKASSSWAFITAWNPYSESMEDVFNQKANERLESEIKSFSYYKGLGIPDGNSAWKPEESFLILGISKERAYQLGAQFEQVAIVYGELSKEAELIFMEYEKKP